MTNLISNIRQIPKTLKMNALFPPAKKFLFILLTIDLLFILLHCYSLFLPVTETSTLNLRLDMDFGYSEIFQYLQFITISVFLIYFFIKERKGVYLIWSFFFLVLFSNDAFRMHELFGENLANSFNFQPMFGLRAKDFGELLVAAILGATFVLPFMHALFLGQKKTQRITLHLLILVSILVFFGVGVDMLHSVVRKLPGAGALTIVEDAGELIAVSLIVYYMIGLYIKEKLSVANFSQNLKFN